MINSEEDLKWTETEKKLYHKIVEVYTIEEEEVRNWLLENEDVMFHAHIFKEIVKVSGNTKEEYKERFFYEVLRRLEKRVMKEKWLSGELIKILYREKIDNYYFNQIEEILTQDERNKREFIKKAKSLGSIDDTFKKISKIDLNFLQELAKSYETPADTFRELSRINNLEIQQELAGNWRTPVEILEKLSSQEELKILERLAGNWRTPVEILEKLSSQEELKILERLAGNWRTPVEILEKPKLTRRA